MHAYWKLDRPLEPVRRHGDGTVEEPIERAHERLIHGLGTDADGQPDVADPRCADRSRVLRLAGTINHKTGAWARVIAADLALAPYPLEELLDGLPAPAPPPPRARHDGARRDPYKQIAPAEYFLRLAGIRVGARRLVRCPVPAHEDTHPSCSVGRSAEEGWCCHAASCGARGTIYDLASALAGGPWGPALRGEHFTRARQAVVAAFGERAASPVKQPDDRPGEHDARPGRRRARTRRRAAVGRARPRRHRPADRRARRRPLPQPAAATRGRAHADRDAARRPRRRRRQQAWSRAVAGGRRTVALERAP